MSDDRNILESVKTNWRFLALIFIAGIFYAENKANVEKMIQIETRLDKKIRVQNEIKGQLIDLRLWVAGHEKCDNDKS